MKIILFSKEKFLILSGFIKGEDNITPDILTSGLSIKNTKITNAP